VIGRRARWLLLAPLVLCACPQDESPAPTPPEPNDTPATEASKPTLAPPTPARDWRHLVAPARWERVPLVDEPTGATVLALARAGRDLWVGTYGHGVLHRRGRKGRWKQETRTRRRGLASDYVAGIMTAGRRVWARSVGHGFGWSKGGGRWRWWGREELGVERLFPTALISAGRTFTVATTDGLTTTADGGKSWEVVADIHGLPGEYLLTAAGTAGGGDALWLGHLGGLARWERWMVRRRALGAEAPARRKVRSVVDAGAWLAVGTDHGVGISADGGESWRFVGARDGMPSGHVYALLRVGESLLAGTAGGLVRIDPKESEVSAVYRNGPSPRRNVVHALLLDPKDGLWVGSGEGLWSVALDSGNPAPTDGVVCEPGGRTRSADHPAWLRPVADRFNQHADQTYLFGTTWGGRYQPHGGIELNNAEGTPVRAVAPGVVTFAGTGKKETEAVIIRHEHRHAGQHTYSVYLHLSAVFTAEGARVDSGDHIGAVGHTGMATNDHLHFAVKLSAEPTDGRGLPSYNPLLFLERLPGTGTIAGVVRDADWVPIRGARIHGAVVPAPAESPFAFAETYVDGVQPDPVLGEDFVIGDVPAGTYPLSVWIGGEEIRRCVRVEPGSLAWVEFSPAAR